MRTKKLTKRLGEMKVRTSKLQEATFNYPLSTVQYWYPFNNNYEYRYSEKKNILYLVMSEPKLEYTDYYIEENTERTESNHGVFSPTSWYCAVVDSDNVRVIAYAQRLGLRADFYAEDAPYTVKDLEKDYKIIKGYEWRVIEDIRKRVMKTFNQQEYNKYYGMEDENRSSMILSRATPSELSELRMIGKVFTMLSVLRKTIRRV